MLAELTALHIIYVFFIVLIIGFMVMRRDTTFICIVGIFTLAITATGSLSGSVMSIFTGFIYAITELLFTTINLIISIIVAMSKTLTTTGINDVMAYLSFRPFYSYTSLSLLDHRDRNDGHFLFLLAISSSCPNGCCLITSCHSSWTPCTWCGHGYELIWYMGLHLSGDFVIQAAPKLTADAAGLSVQSVMNASIPSGHCYGNRSKTICAFYFIKRDMKSGKLTTTNQVVTTVQQNSQSSLDYPQIKNDSSPCSFLLLFTIDVVAMSILNLQGGDATALIGGTSILNSYSDYTGKS